MAHSMSSRYALCLDNAGCDDLVVRKVYPLLPDETALKDGFLRVIDESGEDYLYPAHCFHLIELPQNVERALQRYAVA